jgi:hypothetical protein
MLPLTSRDIAMQRLIIGILPFLIPISTNINTILDIAEKQHDNAK